MEHIVLSVIIYAIVVYMSLRLVKSDKKYKEMAGRLELSEEEQKEMAKLMIKELF